MKKLSLSVALLASGFIASSAFAQIKIATNGPITGDLASYGEQMKRGAEQAVKDINAAGGLLGQKIELLIGDDRCDPKEAVAVANKMKQEKVVFVAGHFCSGSSIPASEVYAEEGILQITPASTNPKFTERGLTNVLRVCGRDDQQGSVAGKWVAKHFKGKNIVIVDDKTAYGKGLADEMEKALNAAGVKAVAHETINPGEKDYTAFVTKLKSMKPDAMYFGGYHPELGLIVRQMDAQGLKKVQVVSGDAVVSTEFWTTAGDTAEGVLVTFDPDQRKNPKAAKVVEAFKKDGYDPEGYTLNTYATIQLWADAVKAIKSTDPKKVAEYLHKNTSKTIIGDIAFDAKGDNSKSGGYNFWKYSAKFAPTFYSDIGADPKPAK